MKPLIPLLVLFLVSACGGAYEPAPATKTADLPAWLSAEPTGCTYSDGCAVYNLPAGWDKSGAFVCPALSTAQMNELSAMECAATGCSSSTQGCPVVR